MFEQELLVPALHLRTEVQLRQHLRMQRAGARLKPLAIKDPSGALAPDGPWKDNPCALLSS